MRPSVYQARRLSNFERRSRRDIGHRQLNLVSAKPNDWLWLDVRRPPGSDISFVFCLATDRMNALDAQTAASPKHGPVSTHCHAGRLLSRLQLQLRTNVLHY